MSSWKSKCLSILGGMNSQRDIKEQTEVYSMVLDAIGEEFALPAVRYAVLNEEWRPSPAKLRQIASRVAAPYPTDDDAYAEIIDKAQHIGLYGMPDPRNPNVFLEGSPPMSHPLIARIVPYLGGWPFICEGEAQMQEGLKKQVGGAHGTVAAQWEQEVAQQLTLPTNRRNPTYFRSYKPYRPLSPMTEYDFLALPPPPKIDDATPPPEPLKRLIACIKSMPDARPVSGEQPSEYAALRTSLRDLPTRKEQERLIAEVKAAQAKVVGQFEFSKFTISSSVHT